MNFLLQTAILILTGTSSAPAGAALKIGIVDVQYALNNVEEGKSMKDNLQKEFDTKKKDVDAKKAKADKYEKEFNELQQKVTNPAMMSPDFMDKLRKLQTEGQKAQQDWIDTAKKYQDEISAKEQKAREEILHKLNDLVQHIGETDGYNLIMADQSGLLFAAPKTPITSQVVQQYNAKYKVKGSEKKK